MFSVLFSLFNFSFKVSDSSSCTFSSRIVRSFWSSSSCICSVSRVYYEYYHLDGTEEIPADYKEISFVCLRPTDVWNCRAHSALSAGQLRNDWTDLRFPFSPVATHLHQQSALQRSCPERCAGTVRTL